MTVSISFFTNVLLNRKFMCSSGCLFKFSVEVVYENLGSSSIW